jgi:hypothetical protein
MPTYIEELVTEIVPHSDASPDGHEANGDPRWQQDEQLKARLKRLERQERRVSAAGFDD